MNKRARVIDFINVLKKFPKYAGDVKKLEEKYKNDSLNFDKEEKNYRDVFVGYTKDAFGNSFDTTQKIFYQYKGNKMLSNVKIRWTPHAKERCYLRSKLDENAPTKINDSILYNLKKYLEENGRMIEDRSSQIGGTYSEICKDLGYSILIVGVEGIDFEVVVASIRRKDEPLPRYNNLSSDIRWRKGESDERKKVFEELHDEDKIDLFRKLNPREQERLFATLNMKEKIIIFDVLSDSRKINLFEKSLGNSRIKIFNKFPKEKQKELFKKESMDVRIAIINGAEPEDKKTLFDLLSDNEKKQLLPSLDDVSREILTTPEEKQKRLFQEANIEERRKIIDSVKPEEKKILFDLLRDKEKSELFDLLGEHSQEILTASKKDSNIIVKEIMKIARILNIIANPMFQEFRREHFREEGYTDHRLDEVWSLCRREDAEVIFWDRSVTGKLERADQKTVRHVTLASKIADTLTEEQMEMIGARGLLGAKNIIYAMGMRAYWIVSHGVLAVHREYGEINKRKQDDYDPDVIDKEVGLGDMKLLAQKMKITAAEYWRIMI